MPMFALLLAALLPTAPAGTELLGRPVAMVEIVAPAFEATAPLLGLIDIEPGYLLSRVQVQQAIERLYALDRFAQIEAQAVAVSDAVRLSFIITPRQQLESLKVVGLRHANKDALVSALKLNPGEEVDDGTAQELRRLTRRFLQRQGYPLAQVQVLPEPQSGGPGVHYRIEVREGPAHKVAQVVLDTDHIVPEQVLRQALKTRAQAVLSQELLDADRDHLHELLVAHGFLSSQVSAPTVRDRPEGAVVVFRVRARARVPVHIVGAHVLRPADIIAMWPAAAGGTPKQMLTTFRQRIEAAYAKAGYVQPAVHLRLHAGATRGVQRVDVHIDEGPVLWVDAFKFKGAHALPRQLLRQQVQAVLVQDLSTESFFEPLGPGDWAVRGAPQTPRPRVPHQVPPQHRWNTTLFGQAADDIAAAYRDLGFLDVTVTPPVLPDTPKTQTRTPRASPDSALLLWPDKPAMGQVPPGIEAQAQLLAVQAAEATFTIVEGQQRFIDSITFAGNTAIDGPTLLNAVQNARDGQALLAPTMPGSPLSYAGIEDGRISIVRKLRELGYLYAKVFSQVSPPSPQGMSQVQYTIEEGPAVHVQKLLVRGNSHTREGIIRSRITLAQGSLYKLNQAITDQREIMALGVFHAVRVRLVDEDHPSEHKDVVAEVEEGERQLIEVSPGLSTTQGLRLRASYSHLNVLGTAGMFIASAKVNRQLFFDLYGGYADKLKTRFAAYRGIEQLTRALEREIRVGLRSPPIKLLRGDPLLRLDVVDQRINAVRYGLNSTSAILGADLTPTRKVRLSVDLQAGITELECPLGTDCDQDLDVRRLRGGHPIQQGTLHTIKFGPTVHIEGRDDPISPSRGFHAFARVYQAFGAAQGTAPQAPSVPFAFLKWEGNASTYLQLFGQVLALSGRVGSIRVERSQVPVDERFFLGGRDTLRGFVETTLIPQDACVVDDTSVLAPAHCAEVISANPSPPLSLGGNTYVLLKSELRMPLRDRFSLDVFCDVGNLWVNLRRAQGFHLRVGTGAGLRYATPVGALTVDFGINTSARAVNREPGYQVHFSIGSF